MVETVTFCYVVLSHRDPERVLALVQRIRELSPSASVLVRHDQRASSLSAAAVETAGGSLLLSDVVVRWGGWSLVEATLEAFAAARERFAPCWTVLVSGQDWPALDLAAWEHDVMADGADARVVAEPLVLTPAGRRLTDADVVAQRYTFRWAALPRAPFLRRVPDVVRRRFRNVYWGHLLHRPAPFRLDRLPRDLGWQAGVRRRRLPFTADRPCWKGEQWLALSADAEHRVGAAMAADPALVALYRSSMVPDESFLQTLLLNDPALTVRQLGVSWNSWDGDAAHPQELTVETAALCRAGRRPFARKLGPDADGAVRLVLDQGVGEPS